MTSRPPRRDHGQAAVELAFASPLIVVAMLAVAQFGVVVRNDLALHHAAREGARAASVSADPHGAARAAARRAVDLDVAVATTARRSTITVTVTYVDSTDVAIVGALIGPVELRASATMALEPP